MSFSLSKPNQFNSLHGFFNNFNVNVNPDVAEFNDKTYLLFKKLDKED
jgi:hypothetical protein